MADTELEATIKINADTTVAKQDIKALESDSKGKGEGGGTEGAGGRFAALTEFVKKIKKMTSRIAKTSLIIGAFASGFGFLISRLAQSSGLLSAALARFRLDVFLMTKQIGDALAPQIKLLVKDLSELAKLVLPVLIGALQALITVIQTVVRGLNGLGEFLSYFIIPRENTQDRQKSNVGMISSLDALKDSIDRSNELEAHRLAVESASEQGFEDLFSFIDRQKEEARLMAEDMRNKVNQADQSSMVLKRQRGGMITKKISDLIGRR